MKRASPRTARRNSLLDIVAQRITGDPDSTWSAISSRFTSVVLPKELEGRDFDNSVVSTRIIRVLTDLLTDANQNAIGQGQATDLKELLESNPRGRKVSKKK